MNSQTKKIFKETIIILTKILKKDESLIILASKLIKITKIPFFQKLCSEAY